MVPKWFKSEQNNFFMIFFYDPKIILAVFRDFLNYPKPEKSKKSGKSKKNKKNKKPIKS